MQKITNIKTTTYAIRDGYYVDVVEYGKEYGDLYGAWLYRLGGYTSKIYLFGSDTAIPIERFLKYIEQNVEKHIAVYEH